MVFHKAGLPVGQHVAGISQGDVVLPVVREHIDLCLHRDGVVEALLGKDEVIDPVFIKSGLLLEGDHSALFGIRHHGIPVPLFIFTVPGPAASVGKPVGDFVHQR